MQTSSQFGVHFLAHLRSFMDTHNLYSKKDSYIGVSGGMDSMALLWCLHKLLGNALNVIHINHGTRKENDVEYELVKNFCDQHKITFLGHKISLDLDQSNFENRARKERKRIFNQYLKGGDRLFLAHHIDDSFEWSLMQQFKSSGLKSSLGIPLKNNHVVRPFMCVTKDHIRKLVKKENIPYLEDKSNDDVSFERNYLRKYITQEVYKKYPKCLKHYVTRSNQLVLELGLGPKKSILDFKRVPEGIVLKSDDLSFHRSVIKECIQELSNKKRGKTSSQIEKLILAHANHKKGPIFFSGGVKAYMNKGKVLFSNQENIDLSVISSSFP